MNEFIGTKEWHHEKLLEKLKANLEKRDFNVKILRTREEVHQFIEEAIPQESSVGLGGSVTTRELGIDTLLQNRGNTLYDHWRDGLTKEEILRTIRKQPQSEYFLTSVNAVTMDGQLVNIDMTGNRVASMIFGPPHVIAFIGVNKLVKDLDQAMWRIKHIATPQNSKRKNLGAPCEKTGYCIDCKTKASLCKITTIIDYRPPATKFTIVLLPLQLGF
jgi:L-lactate utilization protein LutB